MLKQKSFEEGNNLLKNSKLMLTRRNNSRTEQATISRQLMEQLIEKTIDTTFDKAFRNATRITARRYSMHAQYTTGAVVYRCFPSLNGGFVFREC